MRWATTIRASNRFFESRSRDRLHVSNLIYHEYQGRLAEKLCKISGLDRAFFTNSGTESIEGCLKFARAFARPKFRVLSLDQSFHGRTFGALSATGQKQYREQFEPLVPGFDFVKFDDVEDLERKFTDDVCAVLIETIQGEGGIRPISEKFYRAARVAHEEKGRCPDHGRNSVRTWDGPDNGSHFTGSRRRTTKKCCRTWLRSRSRSAWAFRSAQSCFNEKVAAAIQAGQHGTTFGGGPLACRASLEYFNDHRRRQTAASTCERSAPISNSGWKN